MNVNQAVAGKKKLHCQPTLNTFCRSGRVVSVKTFAVCSVVKLTILESSRWKTDEALRRG